MFQRRQSIAIAFLCLLLAFTSAFAQDRGGITVKKSITAYRITSVSGRERHAEGCVTPTGGYTQLSDGRITLVEIRTLANILFWIDVAEVDLNQKTTCLKESVMAFALQLEGNWSVRKGAILFPTGGKIVYGNGTTLVEIPWGYWVNEADLIAASK